MNNISSYLLKLLKIGTYVNAMKILKILLNYYILHFLLISNIYMFANLKVTARIIFTKLIQK